jgi:hypothetical protein
MSKKLYLETVSPLLLGLLVLWFGLPLVMRGDHLDFDEKFPHLKSLNLLSRLLVYFFFSELRYLQLL